MVYRSPPSPARANDLVTWATVFVHPLPPAHSCRWRNRAARALADAQAESQPEI